MDYKQFEYSDGEERCIPVKGYVRRYRLVPQIPPEPPTLFQRFDDWLQRFIGFVKFTFFGIGPSRFKYLGYQK